MVCPTRLLFTLVAMTTVLSLFLAPVVQAAGLGFALYKVDSSSFPKLRSNVSVADSQGVPILGLDGKDFEILEDGKPVTGIQVEPVIESKDPIAIALVIDTSGSMNDGDRIGAARQAASAFIDTIGTKDSVAIVTFANETHVIQNPTSDKKSLKATVEKLTAQGDTSLNDAVIQASTLLGQSQAPRRVILLLSDGEDTKSKNNLDASIAATTASNVLVLSIALGKDIKTEPLDKLAQATQGESIKLEDTTTLTQTFISIGDQLRRQYVVTYTSKLSPDEKPHSIKLTVKYLGQTAEVKGSFIAKKVQLSFDVKGLSNISTVMGEREIEIEVKQGVPSTIELIVGNEVRASVPGTTETTTYKLTWDSTKEKRGIQRVVVRAKDSGGNAIEKEYAIEVVLPTPSPTPSKTPTPVGPTSTPPPSATPTTQPTATPVPVKATSGGSSPTLLLAFGGLLIAGAIGGGLKLVQSRRRQQKSRAPRPLTRFTARPVGRVSPAAESLDPTAPSAWPNGEALNQIGVGSSDQSGGLGTFAFENGAAPDDASQARKEPSLRISHSGIEREMALPRSEGGKIAELVIGRDAQCDIILRDPLASRRHARLYHQADILSANEPGSYWLEDLKSLHGTRVNGEILSEPRKLLANDQIRVGEAIITFLA